MADPTSPVPAGLFAPAKVNLFLHVGPPDLDGRHPLSSLMVFADIGDRVTASPAAVLALSVDGPFAAGLGAGEDNLVLRAARALLAYVAKPDAPIALTLTKQLPLAAGLGGGSSDAGAALRLMRQVLELPVGDDALEAVAASIGSDGPACLWGRPVIAEGRGERLSAAPRLPTLDAVLVNPGVESPTGKVYGAYDSSGAPQSAERPAMPAAFNTVAEVVGFLADCRNDLEAPAMRLAPAIGDVLQALADEEEALLTRVSGSGATCFALCADEIAAEGLAERLKSVHPEWWVHRCKLGGPRA